MNNTKEKRGHNGHVLKYILIFVAVFLIYHIGFGCNIFPTDKETNTLLAPDWYVLLGFALSATVAWLFTRKREVDSHSSGFHEGNPRDSIVTVKRKSQFICGGVKILVSLDGVRVGEIRRGGELLIYVPTGSHELSFSDRWRKRTTTNIFIPSYNYSATISVWYNLKGNILAELSPGIKKVELRNELEEKQEEIPKSPQIINIMPPDPMDIVRELEKKFESTYQFSQEHLLNVHDCKLLYQKLISSINIEEYPLMAQVRFEQLCDEYKGKFDNPNPMLYVDGMDGPAFEHWCSDILRKNGFNHVKVTPVSGDQGVDIIAVKDGIRYAIQCKRYSSDLGNTPIQEVSAGKMLYHCQVGVVMTNQHFTPGAKELAEATGTLLWDREKLFEMVKAAAQQYPAPL